MNESFLSHNRRESVLNATMKVVTLLFFFISLNLLAGNIGIYNLLVCRIIAFCLLLVIVIVNTDFRYLFTEIKNKNKGKVTDISIGFLLLLISSIFLFAFPYRELWLISLPVFMTGFGFVNRGTYTKQQDIFVLTKMG